MRILMAVALVLGTTGCVNWADRRAEVFRTEGTDPLVQKFVEEGRLVPGMTLAEAGVTVKSWGKWVGFNGNPGLDEGTVFVAGKAYRVYSVPNLRLRMYFQGGRLVSYTQHRP